MSIPIKCLPKWCEFVVQNGNYIGLGMYRPFEKNMSNRLFNRNGFEMEFEITSDKIDKTKIIPSYQPIQTTSRIVFNFNFYTGNPKIQVICGVLVRFRKILIKT